MRLPLPPSAAFPSLAESVGKAAGMVELREVRFGGVAQDVDGEGVLVKGGPVQTTGGATTRRVHWRWATWGSSAAARRPVSTARPLVHEGHQPRPLPSHTHAAGPR